MAPFASSSMICRVQMDYIGAEELTHNEICYCIAIDSQPHQPPEAKKACLTSADQSRRSSVWNLLEQA